MTFTRQTTATHGWAVIIALMGALALGAPAGAQTLAPLTARTPVSAGAGWVVWSEHQGPSWRLMASRAGQTRRLPIAGRGVAFDADVGTDVRGRAVVTFSRCASDPLAGPGGAQAWWTADGCHVRVVDLLTGHERAAGVPRPAGASDTTPSMWRGLIAFARIDAKHPIARVMLYEPAKRRLRRLPNGDTNAQTSNAAVQGLDLGSRLVAFLWFVEASNAGNGGWEVLADNLASGRSHLVGTGFIGEACTGGVDGSKPSTPTTTGWTVTYTQLSSSCYQDSVELVRTDVHRRRYARGPLQGEVLEASWSVNGGVALVAPPGSAPDGARCDAPGAPCLLQRVADPVLTPFSPVYKPPFFD